MLLVGFMASGKSTVGRMVAERLGWDFVDFDREIERRAGRTVARIFSEEGEGAFREYEARVGAELLGHRRTVLASGGGWSVAAGRLEALGPETLSVWLRVDAETALERAGRDGDTRPLLLRPDREVAVRALLAERRPFYARARLHLDASLASAERLADEIVERVVRGPLAG